MGASDEIRAVLLDAHGTLLELDEPVDSLGAALSAAGFTLPRAVVASAFAAEVAHYRRHHDAGRNPSSLRQLRLACGDVFAAALPEPRPTPSQAAELLVEHVKYRLFPEVGDVLGMLVADGYRLAVVSNWDCSLADVLASLGIAPLFARIAPSALVGARKPDREHFLRTLRALGVDPSAAVHVGDDPMRDVAGAVRAGIRAVLVDRRPDGAASVSPTISSLGDLPGLLADPPLAW